MLMEKYFKKSIKRAIIFAVIIFQFVLLDLKIGYDKWASTIDPIPWEEFWAKLPHAIGFCILASAIWFCGVFVFLLVTSDNGRLVICVKCGEVCKRRELKNTNYLCSTCGSITEDFNGYYQKDTKTTS